MSNNKIIISIEGNIGVGKSTFIDILKHKWIDGCEIVSEPVDIWKNITDSDGKNILQTFYENIPRWAYSFQNIACVTRMMKIEDAIQKTEHKYIFLDRSLDTDKYVFESMLYDSGNLNHMEHSMYNVWCDFYHKYVRSNNNMIHIYLKAEPKICKERIIKRGRIEEKSIDLEYLIGLNNYHDKWLLSDRLKSNVIVIDCNQEFECDTEKQNEMVNKIKLHVTKFYADLELSSDSKSNNINTIENI